MASTSRATSWRDNQLLLDAPDDEPAELGQRATGVSAEKKRKAVPCGCDGSPAAPRAAAACARPPPGGLGERGGEAARQHWEVARERADYSLTRAAVNGMQCSEEEFARKHALRAEEAAGAWWLPTDADAEAAPAPKKGDGNAWRAEWREMRRDQLDLQEQSELAGADERTTAGRPDSLEWAIRSFSPQINAMVREEWPRGLAEAYTLISCCGAAALARARRDGSEKYKNSESLVVGVLHERAAQMTAAAPRCFAHLSGMLGLAEADPAWRALFSAKPNAAGAAASSASGGGDYGVEPFTTSALVIAIDSPRCLPEAGTTPYHAHLSRGGVKECAAPSSRDLVPSQTPPTPRVPHHAPPPSQVGRRRLGRRRLRILLRRRRQPVPLARPHGRDGVPPPARRDGLPRLRRRQVQGLRPGHEAAPLHRPCRVPDRRADRRRRRAQRRRRAAAVCARGNDAARRRRRPHARRWPRQPRADGADVAHAQRLS